jgi:hypothetical protein
MLWSLISAIFAIFGEKIGVYHWKQMLWIAYVNTQYIFCVINDIFSPTFFDGNIFKIITHDPWPPGVNFTPMGETCLSLGWTLYCLEEWRCEQRIAPPGGDFTPGDKINPCGTTSPWGQSLPLGVKLRMGLWPRKIVLLKVRHEVLVVAERAKDDESQNRQDTWKRSQGV